MRMDAGINGDAQRIEQMVWMLFLKVYDAKEDDWELNEDNYESIIPEDLRWRNWAKSDCNGHSMTGDKLLNFVNNTLFPVLKGNDVGTDGKREKFSRKYAFSCMLECGFCGGTLTRRSWHSGSQYNKVIWQCVTATKKGKKFCPDSKGIAEETIEQAFIESYRLLCQNNKDVLDEFIARTEETLSDSNASKQLAKVEKDIAALDAKRAKLVDMRLEEIIDKDTYEQKYFDYAEKILKSLSSSDYLAEPGTNEGFILKHSVGSLHHGSEIDVPLNYADYYYLEAIQRYMNLKNLKYNKL